MVREIEILDPTAVGVTECQAPSPPLPGLEGRTVGIRVDQTWTSFTRFAERTAALLRERAGVRAVLLYDPGLRRGPTEEERRKVAGFVRDVDAAIVGLGT